MIQKTFQERSWSRLKKFYLRSKSYAIAKVQKKQKMKKFVRKRQKISKIYILQTKRKIKGNIVKLEPEDILEITKTLEPHFKTLIETVNKELQRQINPFVISSTRAAQLLELKAESTLRKRIEQGKYIEGFHYIKKNGKILWHRDNLWLEEFSKSKGIAS